MAQATERWGELIQTANAWLQEQTEPQAEDPALPAPRQVVRRGPRSPRVRAAVLRADRRARPEQRRRAAADGGNSIARSGNWQKLGETLTRALDVAVADDDRKEILTELGELLDRQMNQTDQGLAYYQRALEVDPHYLPALEALERIYDERGENDASSSTSSPARCAALDGRRARSRPTKLRIGGLYETTLGRLERPAQVVPRGARARRREPAGAARPRARLRDARSSGRSSSRVLEAQLDVVTTERERIDVLMQDRATSRRSTSSSPTSRRSASSRSLEIDPNDEERATSRLERCYRRLQQWLELINAYERHITATLDRKTKVELYARDRAGLRRRGRGHRSRDRRLPQHRRSRRHERRRRSKRSRSSTRSRATPRKSIDYMTRVAELTQRRRSSASRCTTASARRSTRSWAIASQAQERFEMALDLDPAHLPTLAALRASRSTTRTGTSRALPRSGAEQHAGAARSAPSSSSSSASCATRCSASTTAPSRPTSLPRRATPTTRTRRCRSSTSTSRTERWEQAEPLAEHARPARAGKRERGEQHTLHNLLGKVLAALGNNEKALKAYSDRAPARPHRPGDDPRPRRRVLPAARTGPSALTNYQKVLTALGEDENEERTDVYYQLGCIKREQGQAKQAINNFEKALGLDGDAPPDARGAGRRLRRASSDWKQVVALQAADPRQRRRRRRALQDARRDRRHLGRQGEEPARRRIEALEEAQDLEPREPHRCSTSCCSSTRRRQNWAQMVDTLAAHRRDGEGARAQEHATSSRWRSSTATRSKIRTARSSSSTRRSI